uniref:Uncharacterized protein n=1 Tax=Arundo donax TaxID=35708 RepID=A0A0A8ZMR4_ARUDO
MVGLHQENRKGTPIFVFIR